MGAYVKGIEPPKRCDLCWFTDCIYNLKNTGLKQPNVKAEDCPIIPVLPHGRLIDADALNPYMLNEHYKYRLVYDADEVANAPTIIPASEEGRP